MEGQDISSKDKPTLTYLALGDSYTIGESVAENERWPVQLSTRLALSGIKVVALEIIAETGWTTEDLKGAIEKRNLRKTFDIVSLLIGVNNQYQNRSIEQYEAEFKELLQTAISLARNNAAKVFVLSIPDYGITPFAKNNSRLKIAKEIDAFNQVNKTVTEKTGAHYFDITPASRKAREDPSLIAEDGLHPSAKMYSDWVDLILSDVIDFIRK